MKVVSKCLLEDREKAEPDSSQQYTQKEAERQRAQVAIWQFPIRDKENLLTQRVVKQC